MSENNITANPKDYLWNYGAFASLTIFGLLINLLIAYFYGSSGLGRFAILYAIFVVTSQFSSFGIHYSALKDSASIKRNAELQSVYSSNFFAVLLTSISFSILLFLLSDFLEHLFESDQISFSIKVLCPAVFLFGINKFFLSFLNGRSLFKIFAIGNIVRYISLTLALCVLISMSTPFKWISLIFIFSEIIVATFCLINIKKLKIYIIKFASISEISERIRFGFKAMFSGLFIELNTRIDVLILGSFVSDSLVGVYSLFSLISEGFYNLFTVIKNILNPRITRYMTEGLFSEIKKLILRNILIIYPIAITISILISLTVYLLILYLPEASDYIDNMMILFILLFSITLVSPFIPFELILTLSGYPELQSIQSAILVLINIILNILLINLYGVVGAAIATASCYIFGIILISIFAIKKLGFKSTS